MTTIDGNVSSQVLKRKDERSYSNEGSIPSPDSELTIERYNHISTKLSRKQMKPFINVEERFAFKERALELRQLIETVRTEQPAYANHLLPIFTCMVDDHNHPVLVCDSPLNVGSDGKVPYRTLQQIIAASPFKRVSIQQVFAWMKVLVVLLAIIHKQNKFLNINSNNILIGKDNQIYIIPTINKELDKEPTVEEARYRAPENDDEQFGKPGQQSDVYALALLFYQMVSGTLPFSGDSTDVLRGRHRNNDPVFSNTLSEPARAVLKKALAKQVEDRYQTVEQLLHELELAYQPRRSQIARRIEVPDMLRRELLINIGTGITTGVLGLALYEGIHNRWFERVASVTPEAYKRVMQYEHKSGVNDAQVSSDRRLLASADNTGFIKLLDLQKRQLQTLPRHHKHAIVSIAWSPAPYAGKYLAVIGDDGWLFIRTIQGKVVAQYKFEGENFTLTWSGPHLSVGVDNRVTAYDDPIQFQFTRPDNVYETDSSNTVNAIASAPGTSPLISIANDNGVFQIWNVEANIAIPLDTFPYGGAFLATKWSSNGRAVAFTGKDGVAFIIAAPPMQEQFLTTWKLSNSQLNSISWAADNTRFAVGGDDARVMVGDIHYRPLGGFSINGPVQATTFTPDGKYIIAAGLGGDVQIRRAW